MDGVEAIARPLAAAGKYRKIFMMTYSARHLIGTGLLSLLVSVATGGGAFAQSGSAGGSIGNEEKSLSGAREAPRAAEPAKPARRSKPEAEEPRRASRKSGGGGGGSGSGGGNFDGSWVSVAVGTPCGSATERFTISSGRVSGELSSGSVSPNGATRSGGSVQGLSWTSTGRFSGRSGSGSFVRSDGCTGRWTASKQ
jgi:hypothetical protein